MHTQNDYYYYYIAYVWKMRMIDAKIVLGDGNGERDIVLYGSLAL